MMHHHLQHLTPWWSGSVSMVSNFFRLSTIVMLLIINIASRILGSGLSIGQSTNQQWRQYGAIWSEQEEHRVEKRKSKQPNQNPKRSQRASHPRPFQLNAATSPLIEKASGLPCPSGGTQFLSIFLVFLDLAISWSLTCAIHLSRSCIWIKPPQFAFSISSIIIPS